MQGGFRTADPLAELLTIANEQITHLVSSRSLNITLPVFALSRELSKADLSAVMSPVAAKLKVNPVEYTKTAASTLNDALEAAKKENKVTFIIAKVAAEGPYLNLFLHRPTVYKWGLRLVAQMGQKFGHTESMKGKKAIVEHTSSNPNSPLHIGNLRSTLLGGHLAKLLEAVGYTVTQLFYVNDLGAQIGLTALGYSRIYDSFQPTMKIDHHIGFIYAIMNTFVEIQGVGVSIVKLDGMTTVAQAKAAYPDADPAVLDEFGEIFFDLRSRQPSLFAALVKSCGSIASIKKEAGVLNLDYEQLKPYAVKIFRKMVTDCLAGCQATLDTYGIHHDRFDFESELGWAGLNDYVLKQLQDHSPYYVPPTMSNAEGKPQGGYLNLAQFLEDFRFPTGKKGFMKDYPPLYVVRPDNSTLYTFRDVVYSLLKVREADMVLNVICMEQNLGQEKVKLALMLLDKEMGNRLSHVSYELVKLSTGKMSGRRGRFVTADELYEDLRDAIGLLMTQRAERLHSLEQSKDQHGINASSGIQAGTPEFEQITHEIATAAMKYALLSSGVRTQISFDVAKITSFDDASAPFLLYNSSRLSTLRMKFEQMTEKNEMPPLPDFESIDFDALTHDEEWMIFMTYIMSFPSTVMACALPPQPQPPALAEWPSHRTCEFLVQLVRSFSSYYHAVRFITPANPSATFQRIYFTAAVKQVLDNGLRLLMIEPLVRM
jgi:arginyl-tRNA synthetase